jgi:hypothetical protein
MAFNSGFAAGSGVENFYDTSVDFGKLSGAAAVQRAMEELNAIKRNSGTFNAIMGADAEAEMEKYRMEGQQNLHDAQMFSKNLGTAAGFLSSGIGAFGKAGGFGSTGGSGSTFTPSSVSKYGDTVTNPMDSFRSAGITGPIYDFQSF